MLPWPLNGWLPASLTATLKLSQDCLEKSPALSFSETECCKWGQCLLASHSVAWCSVLLTDTVLSSSSLSSLIPFSPTFLPFLPSHVSFSSSLSPSLSLSCVYPGPFLLYFLFFTSPPHLHLIYLTLILSLPATN